MRTPERYFEFKGNPALAPGFQPVSGRQGGSKTERVRMRERGGGKFLVLMRFTVFVRCGLCHQRK